MTMISICDLLTPVLSPLTIYVNLQRNRFVRLQNIAFARLVTDPQTDGRTDGRPGSKHASG